MTDIMAYIVSQTALFYPKSTWGLYTTNYDTVSYTLLFDFENKLFHFGIRYLLTVSIFTVDCCILYDDF